MRNYIYLFNAKKIFESRCELMDFANDLNK